MEDAKKWLTDLFRNHHIPIPASKIPLFNRFLENDENREIINTIVQNQNQLMAKWKTEDRIANIVQQPVHVVNGTVGKPYESEFNLEKLDWKDVSQFHFEGLADVGLQYDNERKVITGVPTKSGDLKIVFQFKLDEQPEEAAFTEKLIPLIINPDPKSLWKTIDSDKNDKYWKEDAITEFAPLGDRYILVSSKRGRSHANVGSFREDDFGYKELENGWSIVVVADGAGSARLSRKGSALATAGIIDYFNELSSIQSMAPFDDLLQQYKKNTGEETQKKLNHFVYNNLGKAALSVHKKLESFAAEEECSLKDLHSTLIFTLFKKYDVGYAFLSFGVGDCPIALLNKDVTAVTLLNWLDVGEFGGGTRFITMPEIFGSNKFATRFGFKLIDDFSYLFLMTDGIYDPKFIVEANLPDIRKWQAFLDDLHGKNADGTGVDLKPDNETIADQFAAWMDFWSPGNHDDRTLAIVF